MFSNIMFKNENTFWNKAKNKLFKFNACNYVYNSEIPLIEIKHFPSNDLFIKLTA